MGGAPNELIILEGTSHYGGMFESGVVSAEIIALFTNHMK